MKNKQLERELEERCTGYAREKGLVSVKLENVGMAGIPDRLIIGQGGKTLFIEFKTPNKSGRLSEEQKFWLKYLGGAGHVIDDFDDFIKLIDSVYRCI